MFRYIGRRVLLLVPQLFAVLLVTFIIIRLVPGNPARAQLGSYAEPEAIAELNELLGLDRPLWEQFVAYVGNVARGDLGESWFTGNPVTTDILVRLPATLELITIGLVLALAVGVGLAVAAELATGRFGRMLERVTSTYSLSAGAVPDFWLALILIIVFFINLDVVPAPIGRIDADIQLQTPTGVFLIDSIITGNWRAFQSVLGHLVLPAGTLVFVAGAAVLRMTGSSLREALSSDVIWFARANGLSRMVVLRYALRSAILPVITLVGALYGLLIAGAVFIEQIFNWNGVGQYAVQSVVRADWAPLQGVVLVAACFTLLVFLVLDILYALIDPRIKY